MLTRRYAMLAIGFALFSTIFWLSATHADKPGVNSKQLQTERLFASSAYNTAHDNDDARLEQLRCLALNIYWEARSESVDGQLAVGAVTLNRVKSPSFPGDVCSVVRQGGDVRRHRCQFSWWCDGKRDDPVNAVAWRRASTLARLISAGIAKDPTHGALWYHADYVTPGWAENKERVTKIGRHIFYADAADRSIRVTQNTVSPQH